MGSRSAIDPKAYKARGRVTISSGLGARANSRWRSRANSWSRGTLNLWNLIQYLGPTTVRAARFLQDEGPLPLPPIATQSQRNPAVRARSQSSASEHRGRSGAITAGCVRSGTRRHLPPKRERQRAPRVSEMDEQSRSEGQAGGRGGGSVSSSGAPLAAGHLDKRCVARRERERGRERTRH